MPPGTPTSLPYVTAKSSRILGKIRVAAEDFQVEEIPAYAPSGDGEHLFVKVRKVGTNTREAAHAVARGLGLDPAGTSWAGLKDRHAVTTQWISLQGGDPVAAARLELPGIEVLAAQRHTHKLRTGHLRGNRFTIRLRRDEAGDDDVERASDLLRALETHGCPNYFGEQRFGREGDNATVALAWVLGSGPAPRGRFQRKLLFSSLQASIFNAWLAERVRDGLLTKALPGDLMRKEATGGLFHCEAPEQDSARAARFEISPTGPMFGARMRAARDQAGERELAILRAQGVGAEQLAKHKKYGEGTRRPARIRPHAWSVEAEGANLLIQFELPRGAYATVVLRELTKPTETSQSDHP